MATLLPVQQHRLLISGLALGLLGATPADAAIFIWNGSANNAWNNANNWTPTGTPNSVAGDTVNLSTIDWTAAKTFTLNNGTTTLDRTLGTIIFGDLSGTTNWTVNANGGTGSNPKLILAAISGTPTIQVDGGTTTLNPVLAGTAGFAKTGAGTLLLTNTGNTITGGITLSAGTLAFSAGALGNNSINVAGTSALTWNTAGNGTDLSSKITLGNGFTLTLNLSNTATDNTTFASTLLTSGGNAANIVKANASTLTITAPQIYTGSTKVNNGRLVLSGGDNRLSPSSTLIFGNGSNSGILQLGDSSGASHQAFTSLSISAGSANAIVGGSSTNSILTINNDAAITTANSPLLGGSGANENNLALVKTGAGAFTLSKANTFTGNVTLSGGALILTNNNALGAGTKTVTVSGSTNSPSLQLNSASGISLGSNISFVTSNDSTTAAIVNSAGSNVIAGDITLADGGFGTGFTRVRVNAGSLDLNGAITASAMALTDRTVIFDGASNGAANGLISDNGAIKTAVTKEGAGTWTLSAANSYSGPTTITTGRLNLTTSQVGGGAISVADGASLGVTLAGASATLATSSLSLGSSAGSALHFNLGSAGNPAAAVINTNVFTTAGTNTINVAATGLSVGTFPLISYGSIGGAGFGGLALGALPARVSAVLLDDAANSAVKLNVTAFDLPRWIGSVDGNWDADTDGTGTTGTANWKEVTSGNTTRYLQGSGGIDSVLFDDTPGVPTNVILTTTLTPTTVTVNTALNAFIFSGPGKLSGATNLIKTGSSTLTLLSTGGNDFTGTTTINGGTIQLGDGATADAGSLGAGPVILGAAGTLTLSRPAGTGQDFTVANVFSGGGRIRQIGGNSVTLSGNSGTFSGPVEVASGTVKIGSANALGNATGNTTVSALASLDITGFTIAEPTTLAGGTLKHLSGTSSLNGPLTLDGGGIVDSAAGTLTIGGAISGSGGLVKNGAGATTLSAVNTFTGGLTSNAGTLTLSADSTFGGGLTVTGGSVILSADQSFTGGVTVSNGTLQIGAATGSIVGNAGPNDILLNPGAGKTSTLNILRGDNALNISRVISSSGAGTNLITIGTATATSQSGSVTFSGQNSFTGNVTINGGALVITNSDALGLGAKTVSAASAAGPALKLDGSAGSITLSSNISLRLSSDGTIVNTASNQGALVNLAGDNVVNGNIALVNGGGGNGRIFASGGSITVNGLIDASTATGARTLLLGGGANGTINGVVADWFDTTASATRVVSVQKDGSGTWSLNGANTFTGTVAVQAGTLKVAAVDLIGTPQPLGQAASAITLGTATTAGIVEYTGPSATLARPLTITASGPGGIVKNSGSGELKLSGAITRNNATSLVLTGSAFDVTATIAGGNGAASIVIDGTTAKLSAANTYAGSTRIQGGGTLILGAANTLPAGTTVTLGESANNTAGTLDLNGFDQTLTGIASAGTGSRKITNSAASGVSTVTVTGTSNFAGSLEDGATATVALRKTTGGTLTLSGSSTFTGPVAVEGGTLLVSGSISGTASVLVKSGASLGGTGTITTANGNVTLESGASLSPGSAGSGALSLSLGSGVLDLAGIVAGADTLKFGLGQFNSTITLTTGSLNLGTGIDLSDFVFTDNGAFAEGTYLLIDTNSPITGDLGSNITGTILGLDARLEFADGGHDLVLTVVPEPSTAAAMFSGFGALLGLQRLRRRRTTAR